MKGKIFLIIVLVLSIILSGLIETYAAEARAYATVLIIIPPKEEKTEQNNVKEKEENTSLVQNQANEAKETKKD